MTHSTDVRQQVRPNASHTSANVITNQSKSREAILDDSFSNQNDNDAQNTVNSKFQNEMADEHKVYFKFLFSKFRLRASYLNWIYHCYSPFKFPCCACM